jgi:proteic killer suppression protein
MAGIAELLNNAELLKDLQAPPNNKLEPLKNNRLGQHSIRINNQWRIIFRWQQRSAFDVQIIDYH